MEQNQTQTNKDTVSLWSIVAMFFKKIKVIVAIALLVAIVGGALGVMLSAMNATYSAEFILYASPTDENDSLLYALRSGILNEKILLEENGLPPKNQCDAKAYEAAEKAVKEYKQVRELFEEKYEEMRDYYIEDIESKYNSLLNEYERAKKELEIYKNPQTDSVVDDSHKEMTALLERNFLAAKKALEDYRNEYYVKAKEKEAELKKAYTLVTRDVDRLRDLANEAVEKAVTAWENDPAAISALENMAKYVSFEYLKNAFVENTDPNAEQEVNKKYIKVTVSAPAERKNFVETVVKKYRQNLCDVAEEYVEDVTNNPKSQCEITEFAIFIEREPKSLIVEGVKYAVVCAVVTVLLAFFIIAIHALFKSNVQSESGATEGDRATQTKDQN